MVDSLDPAPQRGEAAEAYPLIAIVGPTAAGKSELSLFLAESLDGEIVNYDSVQVYRGFNIGTGKVPLEARRDIPHHFLDLKDPSELFTAGDFRRGALAALAGVRERGKLPILVGGTGLYLRALLLGLFEGPRRSEELRTRLGFLRERRGREFLHRLLERLDSQSAARIHPRDTQKIIRAVEVCLLARRPLSAALASGRSRLRSFFTLRVGLNPDRGKLSERINQRVEQMFAGGLLEETRILLARTDAPRLKPLEALGYRQASAALRGRISLEEAVRQTQAATRQYAKRQMTWFRREPGVQWFAGFGDDPEVQREILAWLEASRVTRGARTATPFPAASTS